ncbi:MAG TPA: nucleoside deaminase, partial [Methanothrix sp.]|nr:nucleoside deaminase [Methanothrix sp.]
MNEFLALALEEAREGIENDDGGPFGAVIVLDGKVVSRAHNEVLKRNDPTAHAEILA